MPTLPDRFRTRRWAIAAAVGLFLVGGLAGAATHRALAPVPAMAPGAAMPVADLAKLTTPLSGHRIATVRGTVAEVYGSRFVLSDTSGKALVETGGRPGAAALVSTGQQVTVQGGYKDGVLRAHFLVGADGQVTALHGGRGRHHERR